MMSARSACYLTVFMAALATILASPIIAEEIDGRITSVEDEVITITTTSELLPVAGDRVLVLIEIEGVGKAQVGTATVSKVEGGRILAKVESATGRIAAGQTVAIDSPKPVRRAAGKVPPLIGLSAGDAKDAASKAGFVARFEIGRSVPDGAKPLSAYAQVPEAGADLARGGRILITLYGSASKSLGDGFDVKSIPDPPPAPPAASAPPPAQRVEVARISPPAPEPVLAVASRLNGPNPESRQIAATVAKALEKYHLSGHPIDQEISRRTMDDLIRQLDPQRNTFFKQDVSELTRGLYQFDDQLKRGDISFAYDLFRRYLQRLESRIQQMQQFLDMDQDFTIDEEIVTSPQALEYPIDEPEAEERWRLQVKYELLSEIAAGTEIDAARHKLHVRHLEFLKRMQQYSDDDLLKLTLNALAAAYDPHSAYYSARDWKDFVINTKQEMVGIGASLKSVDGGVRVERIVTRGPAHRDGRLKPGDRIVAVGEPDGAMRDVDGLPLNEVVAFIRGKAGSKVRLRVVPDGSFEAKSYEIQRAKFDLGTAAGAILTGERLPPSRRARLGFLHLPSFYVDLEAARTGKGEYRSATRDVRRILEGFAKQDVGVVVLDLRNNGGGGLTESITITGLFIDRGPVLQVKNREGKVQRFDDTEAGTAWNGPLVILTNAFSAGGSEILVGALQDYGRALVVGDSRSQGFGSVQNLIDLTKETSPNGPGAPIDKSLDPGRLKVTMQRFYRPSGDSTQLRGVIPDVPLPSVFDVADVREENKPFALQFDQVAAAASFKRLDFGIDANLVAALSQRSGDRVAESSEFQRLNEQIAALRQRSSRTSISLQRDVFVAAKQSASANPESPAVLPEIPDVKVDNYLEETLNIALDYLARLDLAKAEADYTARRYQQAIGKYRSSIDADPQFVAAHYKLAWALSTCPDAKVRSGKLAVTHAARAVELDGDQNWVYRLGLAVAHAEAGDFLQAQEQLAKALADAPSSSRENYRYLEERFRNKQPYTR